MYKVLCKFIFTCKLLFTIFRYRWIKNGKHFDWQAYDDRISQQPGRGTLVITSPRDEDLGQFWIFIITGLEVCVKGFVSLINVVKFFEWKKFISSIHMVSKNCITIDSNYTVFWDADGCIQIEFLEAGETINANINARCLTNPTTHVNAMEA